ncbi:hypothetical protein H6771_02810 [Candidatus Peribacteria bacterium]|nr:hypothetical protein [Candidatus Peribacteria bacterium]
MTYSPTATAATTLHSPNILARSSTADLRRAETYQLIVPITHSGPIPRGAVLGRYTTISDPQYAGCVYLYDPAATDGRSKAFGVLDNLTIAEEMLFTVDGMGNYDPVKLSVTVLCPGSGVVLRPSTLTGLDANAIAQLGGLLDAEADTLLLS